MDIKTLIYGVLFLFATCGLFYFITIFIQKLVVKIRSRRGITSYNSHDNTDNSESDTITHCGANANKAILEAKKKIRGK